MHLGITPVYVEKYIYWQDTYSATYKEKAPKTMNAQGLVDQSGGS